MTEIFLDDGQGGKSRALIGALGDHAEDIMSLAGSDAPLPCVTDEHIWSLHGNRVADLLPLDPIFVPRGEDAKNWTHLAAVISEIASRNHARGRPVIALGGGAIGDLAGLSAALYRRGTPIIHIPTTLLAQVDSAVGGKTAIDAEGEKNLVGTFHAPALVVADPDFLNTLDARQMRAGMAEIVKYGAIADAEFFDWIGRHGRAVLAADPGACAEAAGRCIRMKAAAVEGDVEDRTGQRALLNFGHSFGHAIESIAGLGTVLHGEAVSVGMLLAARFSAAAGRCSIETPEQLDALLRHLELPSRLDHVGLGGQAPALFEPMLKDKKNESENVTLILLERIGKAVRETDMPRGQLRDFLSAA